jgi:hypothetical protein
MLLHSSLSGQLKAIEAGRHVFVHQQALHDSNELGDIDWQIIDQCGVLARPRHYRLFDIEIENSLFRHDISAFVLSGADNTRRYRRPAARQPGAEVGGPKPKLDHVAGAVSGQRVELVGWHA